ncbi:hypothetical protein NEOLEDRAFT_947747 [Neolentinus lepideus HHB14362 ss-1]|uniref:Uncharacterized protein n=1 Tax=Neolentinus lepideus HHB14362 ss-1 TaxID=1314782 RepID=A0A165UCS8_9AGAM|nr:hypothetical protein NEOLEDRAFT_947747 [Neolentinus lepideus HHB14362 ss-1]
MIWLKDPEVRTIRRIHFDSVDVAVATAAFFLEVDLLFGACAACSAASIAFCVFRRVRVVLLVIGPRTGDASLFASSVDGSGPDAVHSGSTGATTTSFLAIVDVLRMRVLGRAGLASSTPCEMPASVLYSSLSLPFDLDLELDVLLPLLLVFLGSCSSGLGSLSSTFSDLGSSNSGTSRIIPSTFVSALTFETQLMTEFASTSSAGPVSSFFDARGPPAAAVALLPETLTAVLEPEAFVSDDLSTLKLCRIFAASRSAVSEAAAAGAFRTTDGSSISASAAAVFFARIRALKRTAFCMSSAMSIVLFSSELTRCSVASSSVAASLTGSSVFLCFLGCVSLNLRRRFFDTGTDLGPSSASGSALSTTSSISSNFRFDTLAGRDLLALALGRSQSASGTLSAQLLWLPRTLDSKPSSK